MKQRTTTTENITKAHLVRQTKQPVHLLNTSLVFQLLVHWACTCLLFLSLFSIWCVQRLQSLWHPGPDLAYHTTDHVGEQPELEISVKFIK